jgi:hypothetical protein
MIPTEMNLAISAVYWRKGYSDSNPDVGMGPFLETLAKEVLDRANVDYTDEELDFIVEEVRRLQ